MPISISAIFVFPRKFSPYNHFLNRPAWRLLAPDGWILELTGTILGTVLSPDRRVQNWRPSAYALSK
jgi:hypothetical protein